MGIEAHLSSWPSDAAAPRTGIDSKRKGNRPLRFVGVKRREFDSDLNDLVT